MPTTTSHHPPPPPPPPPWPHQSSHNHINNMLGLHNMYLITPPPAPPSSSSLHHQQNQQNIHQDYNNNANDHSSTSWSTLKKTQELSLVKKDGVLRSSVGEDAIDDDTSLRVCRDCGNKAKKECEYRRCRTCCKNRGYDCATHLKSTWVPASRRRERKVAVVGSDGGDGVSSGSSSGGGKKPRIVVSSSQNVTATSNTSTSNTAAAAKSISFETGSCHQDAGFKKSLPGQVRAPAVFRCIRVTALSDGEAEVGYQATVNICGHVFKGFLSNQGIDEKNVFPCISKVNLECSTSGRNRDSSSPIVDPPDTFAASKDQGLLQGDE